MEQPSRGLAHATTGATAAVSFIVACVAHEAVGHAGTCLAVGGRVILLTSVYFTGANGGPLTDAAGPVMNLVVGAACWRAACSSRPDSLPRFFFVMTMAFNLFWGGGYFIFSALTNTGDWAFVMRDLSLEPRLLWRLLIGALGIAIYSRSLRAVARLAPGMPLVRPYLVAGAVACASVLGYGGPVLPALREAAQESLGANVGLLYLACRRPVEAAPGPFLISAGQGRHWILFSTLLTVLFFLTLGRGYEATGHT
jgi:hypothetical protein